LKEYKLGDLFLWGKMGRTSKNDNVSINDVDLASIVDSAKETAKVQQDTIKETAKVQQDLAEETSGYTKEMAEETAKVQQDLAEETSGYTKEMAEAGWEGIKDSSKQAMSTISGHSREILGSGLTEVYDLSKNMASSLGGGLKKMWDVRQEKKKDKSEEFLEDISNSQDEFTSAALSKGSIYTHDVTMEGMMGNVSQILETQEQTFSNMEELTAEGQKMQAESQRITIKALDMLYDRGGEGEEEEDGTDILEVALDIFHTLTSQSENIELMRISQVEQMGFITKFVQPMREFYTRSIKNIAKGNELVENRLVEIRGILSRALGINERDVAVRDKSLKLIPKLLLSPLLIPLYALKTSISKVYDGIKGGNKTVLSVDDKRNNLLFDILKGVRVLKDSEIDNKKVIEMIRAPKGGIDIEGKQYKGGQFLPKDMTKAIVSADKLDKDDEKQTALLGGMNNYFKRKEKEEDRDVSKKSSFWAFLGKLGPAAIAAVLATGIAGLGWAVSDAFGAWAKASAGKWGSTDKISAAFGGFLGGEGSGLWNALKQGIKGAAVGMVLGLSFGPPGIIIGAILGATMGGLLGWIGGLKIAKWIDGTVKLFRRLFDLPELLTDEQIKATQDEIDSMKAGLKVKRIDLKGLKEVYESIKDEKGYYKERIQVRRQIREAQASIIEDEAIIAREVKRIAESSIAERDKIIKFHQKEINLLTDEVFKYQNSMVHHRAILELMEALGQYGTNEYNVRKEMYDNAKKDYLNAKKHRDNLLADQNERKKERREESSDIHRKHKTLWGNFILSVRDVVDFFSNIYTPATEASLVGGLGLIEGEKAKIFGVDIDTYMFPLTALGIFIKDSFIKLRYGIEDWFKDSWVYKTYEWLSKEKNVATAGDTADRGNKIFSTPDTSNIAQTAEGKLLQSEKRLADLRKQGSELVDRRDPRTLSPDEKKRLLKIEEQIEFEKKKKKLLEESLNIQEKTFDKMTKGNSIFTHDVHLEELLKEFLKLFKPFVESVKPIVESLEPMADSLAKSVKPVVESLAKSFTPMAESLEPIVESLAKSFTPVVESLAKSVKPIVESLAKSVKPIVESLAKSFTPAIDSLAESFTPMAESLAKSVKPIVESLEPIVESLEPMADSLAKSVKPIVESLEPIVESLEPIVESLAKSFTPVVESLAKSVKPIVESLAKSVKPIVESLAKSVKPIVESLEPIVESLAKSVKPVVESLAKSFTPMAESLVKSLNPVSEAFAESVKPVAESFGLKRKFKNKNIQKGLDWFTSEEGGGYTKEQAIGIIGNLLQESQLDPKAFNKAGGGKGARGIAQWRGSRLKDFEDFIGKSVLDSTYEDQLRFYTHEMSKKGKEFRAGKKLRATTGFEDATLSVRKYYERGPNTEDDQRLRYGKNIYDNMASVKKPGGKIESAEADRAKVIQDIYNSRRETDTKRDQDRAEMTRVMKESSFKTDKYQTDMAKQGSLSNTIIAGMSGSRGDVSDIPEEVDNYLLGLSVAGILS